jgi:uncharacterized membrane protein YfcA
LMKPTSLTLNILVATIATVRFYRAGFFSWRIFLPFAVSSIPFAFLGGALTLPSTIYQKIVGAVLIFAAYRLWVSFAKLQAQTQADIKPVPIPLAVLLGACIGFLSGLTGVGGGIFLSPLVLLVGWAETRQMSGVAAAFILVNSVAGLGGQIYYTHQFPVQPGAIYLWGAAAVVGGLIGTELGRRRLAPMTLRRVLAVVLVIAGVKLMLTGVKLTWFD